MDFLGSPQAFLLPFPLTPSGAARGAPPWELGANARERPKRKKKDLNGEDTNNIAQCKSYFMLHLGADVLSWKLLLKMHGQDWELSALSAAGSEVTAGGSSEHTGGDRAPFLP